MADRFDVVPVRANDESCKVIRVVVRAQTGRAIVFSTRLQGRAIEGFDLPAILGRERQVKMRRILLGLIQAQYNKDPKPLKWKYADPNPAYHRRFF